MSATTTNTETVPPVETPWSAEQTEQAQLALVRQPVMDNNRDMRWLDDQVASAIEKPTPLWWWLGLAVSALLASFTGLGLLYLITTGVGVWGENNNANWAWDITNFVFWIGIGHAGTMIAAILFLTRQKWASGINRAAEAMTIFAVSCAGIYPAVHVGRVWFAWYLAPIPNANAIWPDFRSPLLWDVFAVSTYLSVSIVFWYVGLIPDMALMRDRSRSKFAQYFYGVLCLGWRGSARQWMNYEFCYLMLAGIATLLVITTCTVVSSDFSTSVEPGWHGTVFLPYFGVGAIYGGFCMLITLLVPLRQLYKLEDIVTLRHIDLCCRFVLFMALLITYIYGMEFFMALYGGNRMEMFTFKNRVLGPYGVTWFIMIFCNCAVPQLFWIKSVRRNPWLVWGLVIFPSIGMWLERFVIIVSSIHRDYLPSSWGMFYPTWVDGLTYTGTFGVFFLLYLLFIRFLPVIAISEIKAALPQSDPHYHSDEPAVTPSPNIAPIDLVETPKSSLIIPAGTAPLPRRLYGIAAEFSGPAALYHAAEKLRAKGLHNWECYSPHPIHGLEQAMGVGKSWVGMFTLIGGAGGLATGFLLQFIPSAYVYPIITQGKPFFSLPAFVPIMDLLMIIGMTALTVGGMTTMNLLPRLYHPLFEWPDFRFATRNKYFVVIESEDPKFNEKNTPALLTEVGGTNLTFIALPGDAE